MMNGYTIQDLRKILNLVVKDYEIELGEPDKVINTIFNMEEIVHGYYSLINQCRIYLKSKKLIFVTTDSISIIPFNKIIGYEVINLKDLTAPLYTATTATTTTSTGDVIKRAVIGGVLAGGVGAVIGGATAKSTTKQESNFFDYLKYQPNLELRINTDDILSPLLKIPFDGFNDNANEVASILNVIIKRNADNQNQEESVLFAKSLKFEEIGISMGIPPYNIYKKSEEDDMVYKVITGSRTDIGSIFGIIIVVVIILFVFGILLQKYNLYFLIFLNN